MLRLRHTELVATSTNDGVAENNLLHRLLRLDPRTASQCETIADVDTHLQTELVGLLQGAVYHLPEIRTQRIGLSLKL